MTASLIHATKFNQISKQVQHEVEGITLYFENSQNVNQGESKSSKDEVHVGDLHHPFELHLHHVPFFGDGSKDDKKIWNKKKPKLLQSFL